MPRRKQDLHRAAAQIEPGAAINLVVRGKPGDGRDVTHRRRKTGERTGRNPSPLIPYTHIGHYGNMGPMKTTVEIADSLFEEAKAFAASRRVPLRQLIEEGLRAVIGQERAPRKFRLHNGSVGGKGLRDPLSWPAVRGRIYEGRGE